MAAMWQVTGAALVALTTGYGLRPAVDNFLYTDVHFTKAGKPCPYGWVARSRYKEVADSYTPVNESGVMRDDVELCIYEPIMRTVELKKVDE